MEIAAKRQGWLISSTGPYAPRIVDDELLDKVIISTGPEAYRRQDGVAGVPLALLGP